MKIKQLNIKNFGKIEDIQIQFAENVTYLVGINGSGKTSIINSIWACFKGIAERGFPHFIADRWRMIGDKEKSADINLILYDEQKKVEIRIKRHITKDTNQIKFEAPNEYQINESWLTNLLDISFMSANQFTSFDSKKQAEILGIDTSEIDNEIIKIKEEAKHLRREIKDFGEIREIKKVDRIDINLLLKERDEIVKFNNEQNERQLKIKKAKGLLEALNLEKSVIESQIINFQDSLKDKIERIKKGIEYLNGLPEPEKQKDTASVDEKLNKADQINRQAMGYQKYIEEKSKKKVKEAELKEVLDSQKNAEQKRTDYITSHNFGIKEIAIDETGSLLCQGKPIREPYFSTGELEMIVARLAESMNPDLKVRFIDGFERLDKTNQEKLIADLLQSEFQVIVTQVGNKRENENTILLKDCTILDRAVKEYE